MLVRRHRHDGGGLSMSDAAIQALLVLAVSIGGACILGAAVLIRAVMARGDER